MRTLRMWALGPLLLVGAVSALLPSPALLRPRCRPQPQQISAVAGANVRVRLRRPLGIVFEEVKPGEPEGVVVADVVENGTAWKDGRVCVGDRLLKCSAVIFGGEPSLVTVGAGRQLVPGCS